MYLNTRDSYGLIAQILHWTTAVMILVLLPLGIYMHELPVTTADEAAHKYWYYSLHKTLGVTVFFVAVIRVAWALVQPSPRPLNGDRAFESLVARTVHWALYGAIIAMPLTGWLLHSATEGAASIWWPFPQDLPWVAKSPQWASFFLLAHFCTGCLLVLSIALHIAGAVKHVVIDRDDTLRRMIPGAGVVQSPDLSVSHSTRLPAALALLAFFVVGAATLILYAQAAKKPEAASVALKSTEKSSAMWQVDMARSRLGIQVTQSGRPTSGAFKRWNARIDFNPQRLDKALIEVEVDIASLELGSVSTQAISSDFLNSKVYPVARFISRKVIGVGKNRYEAHGDLTLAGHTNPLILPFNLTISNKQASATAEIALDRLAFEVGKEGFPGGKLVGIEVQIQITIEAERGPPA